MESKEKVYLFVISFLVIMIAIFGYFKLKTADESPKTSILEECKTLEYNGENKIDFVFFATKEQTKQYADFFLNAYPLNQQKSSFNFYYIDNYFPECNLYKNIAMLCDSKEIKKKAASCPYDFIVVVKEKNSEIRSSSYINIMSINSKHQKTVFLHEFGHAFASLAEEYLTNQKPARGSKNCVKSCNDFESQIDGCFQECSSVEYSRSVDEGVMRTLSPRDSEKPYGTYDSQIITNLIQDELKSYDASLSGQQILNSPNCKNTDYLLADINLEEGKAEYTVEKGCLASNGVEGNKILITNSKGDEIFSDNVQPQVYTDAQLESSNQLLGESYAAQKLLLSLPLLAEADKLQIIDSEGKTLFSNAQFYAAGNELCKRK